MIKRESDMKKKILLTTTSVCLFLTTGMYVAAQSLPSIPTLPSAPAAPASSGDQSGNFFGIPDITEEIPAPNIDNMGQAQIQEYVQPNVARNRGGQPIMQRQEAPAPGLGAPTQQFDENGFLITDAYAANMAKGGENPLAGFDMDPNAMMNSAISNGAMPAPVNPMNPVAGADPMFPGFGPNGAGQRMVTIRRCLIHCLLVLKICQIQIEMLTLLLRVWVCRLE